MAHKDLLATCLTPELIRIAEHLQTHSIAAYLVGGCVRDAFLGLPTTDMDVEVYGVACLDDLVPHLKKFGKINLVGQSYAVAKLTTDTHNIDFTLPRVDEKTGAGHRGFVITVDPNLTFKDAASRRDFTINAMGLHILSGQLEDPFDGQKDLQNKTLRHINSAFSEDPLRVLRAIQFAARFNFKIHPETVALCKQIDLTELAKERVFDEFKKCLLRAERPSAGLSYFFELGIDSLVPLAKQLKPIWEQQLQQVDALNHLQDDKLKLLLTLAALVTHKPGFTESEFIEFFATITTEKGLLKQVFILVEKAYKPFEIFESDKKEAALRRLSLELKLSELFELLRAIEPQEGYTQNEVSTWLKTQAKKGNIFHQPLQPLLTGKMLLEMGIQPGPEMGKMIAEVLEKQILGEIGSVEDARAFVLLSR